MTWISDITQDVEIASFDNEIREFAGMYTYRAIAGCGLPPLTCFEIPDQKAGFAAVRNADDTEWNYIADRRGEKVYSTDSGAEVEVTDLGDYPDNTTTLKPSGPYDKWDGKAWFTDAAAEHAEQVAQSDAKKSALIAEATHEISILSDAVEFGIATPEETERYNALRKYRVLLNRVDTSTAPDIAWPLKP